jgi:hypothetical protein
MRCAQQQINLEKELPMTALDRIFPWPHGLLPRRLGESVTSLDGSAARPTALPPANDAVAEPARPETISVGERRAEALRAMFPMLFSMFARRSDLWQAIGVERYLSQAKNLADLELRIQEVQRRRSVSWSE